MQQKLPGTTRGSFTVLELFVVCAVCALVVWILILVISDVIQKSRITRAESDTRAILQGVELLVHDTDNWPGGCTPDGLWNEYIALDKSHAGLVSTPPVDRYGACEWTPEEVGRWKGQYVTSKLLHDPWGQPYIFHMNYLVGQSNSNIGGSVGIVSTGPDRILSTIDDIFIKVWP